MNWIMFIQYFIRRIREITIIYILMLQRKTSKSCRNLNFKHLLSHKLKFLASGKSKKSNKQRKFFFRFLHFFLAKDNFLKSSQFALSSSKRALLWSKFTLSGVAAQKLANALRLNQRVYLSKYRRLFFSNQAFKDKNFLLSPLAPIRHFSIFHDSLTRKVFKEPHYKTT